MKHKVIKTDNYLLVVDESEIKVSDWCIMFDSIGNIFSNPQQYTNPETQHLNKGLKKIIAYLPLNNAPILEGVPLLPPLEDDVEKLAKEEVLYNDQKRAWWKQGYNKAKEKYKYTEEEYNKLLSFIKKIDDEGYDPYDSVHHLQVSRFVDEARNIIQSLQQPKYPVAFESTIGVCSKWLAEQCDNNCCGKPEKIMTITNSQGQTQLVGTYIYE